MQINPTIDLTNVPAASQAGFTAAVNAACSFYDLLFTNNVTLNITFNFATVQPGAVATNSAQGNYTTYSAVKSALLANANSSDALTAYNTLPATDPTNGGTFFVTEAQYKAWGLAYVPPRGTTGAQDATVTLSNSAPWDFSTTRGAPNDNDAVGALEHEISEAMGRVQIEGTGQLSYNLNNNTYTALDLFRYATVNGAVTRVLTPGPGSFSLDGKTLLQTYNDPTALNASGQPQGGDLADWASQVVGDSYGGNGTGIDSLVSKTDMQEMNVIGWQLLTSPTVAQAQTLYADNPISNFGLSIVDRAINVSNAFDALASLTTLGAVRSIQLTDLVPAITLTSTQVNNDAALFPIIHGSYTLSVALSGPSASITFRLPSNVVDFTLTGSGSALLTANSTNDIFILDATGNHTIQAGGLGNYTIESNAGSTALDYSQNATNVTVNLVTDTVTKGLTFLGNPLEGIPPEFSRDTFTNVSTFLGSEAGGNTFKSIGTGAYTFGGLGTNNTLDYSADTGAVTIHLSNSTVVKDLLFFGNPVTGTPPEFWEDGFVNIQSFVGNANANDTIVFAGTSNQYTIVNDTNGSVSVIDSIPGSDDSVQIDNISNVQFADKIIAAPLTYSAGGGNISFTGNGAHDAILFDGSSAQYSIVNNGNGVVTTTDSVSGRDGIDQIASVEFLRFTDKIVFLENADNSNIARLFSAALDRTPDTGGLSSWEDFYTGQISAAAKGQGVYAALAQTPLAVNGLSIADGFIESPEFQAAYGSLNNTQFVNQLYENVLGRAADPAGLAGWLNLMQTQGFTQGMVLVGFAESTENIAKDAGWLITV